ncbi:MAG: hypothetical protein IPF52_17890 [Saprospiraceae bacterium]|nr:hypothetical protein [Saprospiraceae bacterium]MBK8081464.1 hypothetical protein [Saprospiraceae bacterium]
MKTQNYFILWLFVILLFNACVYKEVFSIKREFYIEINKGIDTADLCLQIIDGKFETVFISEKDKKYIYKITLNPIEGGKTRGLINKDLTGDNAKRIVFDNCDEDLLKYLTVFTYENIIKFDHYKKDSLSVYILPLENK